MNSPHDPADTVTTAIAAIQEALKFVPGGKRSIPQSALRSERSRAMLAADPKTFERERMLRLFRSGFGGSAAPPTASRPIAPRSAALRLQVSGRCPGGSFSPDGSQLAVASGFQQVNGTPDGEVSVFATDDGRCLQRHEFEAYTVRVLHTGSGVLVADWQIQDGVLASGQLARYTTHGRDVLIDDVGINLLVHTPSGFAAMTHQGELLLGVGSDIRMLPPPGPRACLAFDPVSERIAVGGDQLVLLDTAGRRVAAAAAPAELLAVAFLRPDQLISSAPGSITLWQLNDGALTVKASTSAVPHLASLAVVPQHRLVVGIDRELWTTVVHVGERALHVIETPQGMHGKQVWGSPLGDRIALPYRINDWLPPASERVDVYDTRAW